MNLGSSGLKLSDALDGFLQFKEAEGRSPRTLEGYRHNLGQLLAYSGEKDVDKFTAQELRAFLNYLRTDYQPKRLSGNPKPLSPKTVRNFWVSLAALFTWLEQEFSLPSPMKNVPGPKFPKAEIEPFTETEVQALLKACDYKRQAAPADWKAFAMRRPTALRDRAIVLVLVDTGLRASELCALRIGDFDLKSGKLVIRHGAEGGAKGGKGRLAYLGKAACRSLWRYLVSRDDKQDDEAPLFASGRRHLNRDSLRQMVAQLGENAQVKKSHPHRFRHTFAIAYLRAGGDVFTLQRLLGHSSLDMVLHYSRIAQIDIEQAHRKASPADNWRL